MCAHWCAVSLGLPDAVDATEAGAALMRARKEAAQLQNALQKQQSSAAAEPPSHQPPPQQQQQQSYHSQQGGRYMPGAQGRAGTSTGAASLGASEGRYMDHRGLNRPGYMEQQQRQGTPPGMELQRARSQHAQHASRLADTIPQPQQQQQQPMQQQVDVRMLQEGLQALLLQNAAAQAALSQQQQQQGQGLAQDAAIAAMQRSLSGASARSGSMEGTHQGRWNPAGSQRQLSSTSPFEAVVAGAQQQGGYPAAAMPGSLGLAAAAEHLSNLQGRPSGGHDSSAGLLAAAALQERAASLGAGGDTAMPGSPAWAAQGPGAGQAGNSNPFAGGVQAAMAHAALQGNGAYYPHAQQGPAWHSQAAAYGLSPQGSAGSLGTRPSMTQEGPSGIQAQPELQGSQPMDHDSLHGTPHAAAAANPGSSGSGSAAPPPGLPEGGVVAGM